jgi:hypothetical protein
MDFTCERAVNFFLDHPQIIYYMYINNFKRKKITYEPKLLKCMYLEENIVLCMHKHIEHRTIINYQTVWTHLPPGQWTIRPLTKLCILRDFNIFVF